MNDIHVEAFALAANFGQRIGQAYFNAADKIDRKWADDLRGTIFDPFYDDSKLPRFLELWHLEHKD